VGYFEAAAGVVNMNGEGRYETGNVLEGEVLSLHVGECMLVGACW